MNDKEFQNFKKQVLHCPDASKKGDIDEHIRGVCDKINSHAKYVTLSSCSGRTAVVVQVCTLHHNHQVSSVDWN